MDLKSLLNKEQYEGATTIEGQVLILAGAGSGKTRVLTHRMAHMIDDLGILPYKILAITFTNKAAKEMKDRVKALIGERAEDMWISTFHSTCVRILRREIEKIGYKKSFTIYDSSDQKTLVKECMKALNINDKDLTEQEIISKISKAKDNMQSPASFMREHESNFREKKVALVYEMYQRRLKENNALDFDDLISKTVELFKKDKETLEFYQRKFQYIMVDEYQDTNKVQYELVRLLADKYKNICVVGDDDQCLVPGTLIDTEKGKVNIEDLKENEKVRVAAGNGEVALLNVANISKKEYKGELIKVTTESGRVIKGTPNHITFAIVNEVNKEEVIFFESEVKNNNVHNSNVYVDGNMIETFDNYDKAEEYIKRISVSEIGSEIVRKAKLTKDNNFKFMPLGSLKEGLLLAVNNEDKIVEERIISLEREDFEGYVYDLNVDYARNYIANGIVVHNCIYQWRGADIRNILDFEKDYPNAKVIKLEQNYRSKGNILGAANEVIINNSNRKSKVLRTEQENGNKIKVYRAYSDSDEGDFVATQINTIKKEDGKSFNDFAILYRTNAQSRVFEESFRRKAIPYKILGGTRFYDRKEIKDLLSYLKVLVNPNDSVSLKRIINVPKRGIGDATINKIMDFAESYELQFFDALESVRNIPTLTARNCGGIENFMELIGRFMELSEVLPVSNLVETILKETGYLAELEKSQEIEDKSRIENLKELVSDAVEFERSSEDKSLMAYLEKVSLVQDTDKLDNEDEAVVLMTVHSAKGLEFPVVFMVGMENGIFPGNASFNSASEMEESRRLCYVGITRAKEQLFMTSAEVRRQFGKTVAYSQSDFINEIKPSLKEYVSGNSLKDKRESYLKARPSYNTAHGLIGGNPSSVAKRPTVTSIDTSEFSMGRKVKHQKFGTGTIVSVANVGDDKKLTIAFDMQGIKHLMLSLANLELL